MSIYNIVNGENAFSDILLGLLFEGDNEQYNELGRYRDTCLSAYPSDDEYADEYADADNEDVDVEDYLYIGILTRNGGGNREEYEYVFDTVREHPDYYTNYDCTYDYTYAMIWFKIPVSRLLQYLKKCFLANNVENYREVCVRLLHPYKKNSTKEQVKEWIDKFFDTVIENDNEKNNENGIEKNQEPEEK